MRKIVAISLALLALAGCAESDVPETEIDMTYDSIDMGSSDAQTFTPDAFVDTSGPFGEPCDPFAQDCAEGKCVPNPEGGSTCLPDLESRSEGTECENIAQCAPRTHCVATSGDPVPRCRAICESNAADTCAGDLICAATLQNNPSIGICVFAPEPCDIYAQDCEAPDACIVMADPMGNGDGTFCGTPGDRTTGQPCGSANGECAGGFICLRLANADFATCQPVCRDAADGPEVECPPSLDCIGTAAASGVTFCQ